MQSSNYLKKISFISPMWPSKDTPYYGSFVKRVSEGLSENGWIVHHDALIVGCPDTSFQKLFKHLKFGMALLQITYRKRDLIYAHSPSWFGPILIVLTRLKGIPLVINLHGSEVFPELRLSLASIFKSWVGWTLERTDLVVVPSNNFFRVVIDQFNIDSKRLSIFPSGGVNCEHFKPTNKLEAKAKLNLPKISYVLGYVGRIDADKGWDTFLKVIDEVRKKRVSVLGLSIGTGAEHYKYQQLIETLSLSGIVAHYLTVNHIQLVDYYNAMDVLLFPSRLNESLGLVPIEAMACGIPVIGSNIGAVKEYINNKENGYLCIADDLDEFIDAVLQFGERSHYNQTIMSRNAREMSLKYEMTKNINELSMRLILLLEEYIQ